MALLFGGKYDFLVFKEIMAKLHLFSIWYYKVLVLLTLYQTTGRVEEGGSINGICLERLKSLLLKAHLIIFITRFKLNP